MKSNDFDNIVCPIADVLGVMGDKWAGLILRDLMLGVSRYSDFSESSNITHATLSSRLKQLEQHGLIEKQQYQTSPARYEYHLTEQGKDLALVMVALAQVGSKWNLSGWEKVPLRFVRKSNGNPLRLALLDSTSGEWVGFDDVAVEKDKVEKDVAK
ncbi:helix-turn-helix transcriptional regulator [Eikenella sp. S3360]|uniref:Helix-turn-helix transcriptional regulator n=1 Tax=Eikenella glucosivorans TaxID=2766967 RepID=A0ABS0NBE2_9NEIS|nr:helix-turn-helix domain-containing protein [Eikenella glucosivorans]MBH5329585.1 helix-turn-helix transcriptional regulator [Eikenella glucosivorans]